MAPYYRLFDDELRREILSADDVDGFFTDAPQPESALVGFLGTTLPAAARPQSFEDVELQVLDRSGQPMARYYIGAVDLTASAVADDASGATDVLASLGGYSLPYPGAREIWRRWASGVPVERGEWRSYRPDLHGSWLHVVQQSWFGAGRRAKRHSAAPRYLVDGADMPTIASFYCALGEAVNGAGGYFGSNPSALEDCLAAGGPGEARFELVWQNFAAAEQRIDEAELGYVLAVLRDAGVDLERRDAG
ncbi:barstar family protein [Kitasatospora viridis]|uniref:Barstar (Barnase inhibitor) n=1 Tax=Kitasatospora viridis TaxID=281105 RepID=A0A561UGZ8_9ACTN|nr:barstar family protein [Kitasatospora viridis]TWF98649.1 barstar (barnase inhibitor) [Kitasatospora viridis]